MVTVLDADLVSFLLLNLTTLIKGIENNDNDTIQETTTNLIDILSISAYRLLFKTDQDNKDIVFRILKIREYSERLLVRISDFLNSEPIFRNRYYGYGCYLIDLVRDTVVMVLRIVSVLAFSVGIESAVSLKQNTTKTLIKLKSKCSRLNFECSYDHKTSNLVTTGIPLSELYSVERVLNMLNQCKFN